MLPVDAEARAMSAPQPRQGIVEIIASGHIETERRTPDIEAGLGYGNPRRADPQTVWAILGPNRKTPGADKEVREAQIVDQRRANHAGEAEQALVSPGRLARPRRRIPIRGPYRSRGKGD